MDTKAGRATTKIQEKDVRGLKYFDQLAPLLERLHKIGCERDFARNRVLHYDQYCMLILLYFFNPVVKSLRGLQQASELKNVQKKLGCPRSSLGSLSESVSVFDPEPLKEIVADLGGQLEPLGRDPRLKDSLRYGRPKPPRHSSTLLSPVLGSELHVVRPRLSNPNGKLPSFEPESRSVR